MGVPRRTGTRVRTLRVYTLDPSHNKHIIAIPYCRTVGSCYGCMCIVCMCACMHAWVSLTQPKQATVACACASFVFVPVACSLGACVCVHRSRRKRYQRFQVSTILQYQHGSMLRGGSQKVSDSFCVVFWQVVFPAGCFWKCFRVVIVRATKHLTWAIALVQQVK